MSSKTSSHKTADTDPDADEDEGAECVLLGQKVFSQCRMCSLTADTDPDADEDQGTPENKNKRKK